MGTLPANTCSYELGSLGSAWRARPEPRSKEAQLRHMVPGRRAETRGRRAGGRIREKSEGGCGEDG